MLALLTFALAHVGLEDPPPRYPSDGNSDNKSCPCGVGNGGTLCQSDPSDPDRSTFVTTYQPGETITVTWHETIGHAGRWRIAFDDDGADMVDFNANVLLDIPDPSGSDGNTGDGDLWQADVTLPSAPCDTCTLQLIQVMDGDTAQEVDDPTGRSTYYQCADIVIAGEVDDPPTGDDDDETETGVDDAKGGCGCGHGAPAGLWLALLLPWARRRTSSQSA